MRLFAHVREPRPMTEKQGEDGTTHVGTVTVDYEYQVEQWVIEFGQDHPEVVYARSPDLRRAWRRKGATKEFEEVPYIEGAP